MAKKWEKHGGLLFERSVQCGFTKHARMLKILTSKPWRSTHHTLGHVATAAWQVFPRQCFHLVLLPVIDLIHYLTFLLPPLETQQAHKLHLPICPASVFPRTCLVLLIRRQSKRKVIQWTTSSRLATLFRTNRKSDIRSVNCISLVGLRIFSW